MAVWLLTPQAGEAAHLFFILALCMVCLGATAVLSPSRSAYYAFMAPMVLPAAYLMLLGRPEGFAVAGWAVLIYLAVLVGVHDALHRNLVATFRRGSHRLAQAELPGEMQPAMVHSVRL
jgi:hypothetical protein